MTIGSNLDIFFSHFAVEATLASGVKIKVILDEPDAESLSLINGPEVQARGKTTELKELSEGDSLTIEGDVYTVKYVRAIDDGKTSIVSLSKE